MRSAFPPRDSTPEQRIKAAEELRKNNVSCRLLKVVSDACYRCEHNPDSVAKKESARLIDQWSTDLNNVGRLHDAVRMGLITDLAVIDPEYFDKLRIYWWEIERLRMVAGIKF